MLRPLSALLALFPRLLTALNELSIEKGLLSIYSSLLTKLISLSQLANNSNNSNSATSASSNKSISSTLSFVLCSSASATTRASATAAAASAASVGLANRSRLARLGAVLLTVTARLSQLLLAILPARRHVALLFRGFVYALRAWSVVEVAFYGYYLHRRRALTKRSIPDELPPTAALRRAHIRRLLNNVMASGRCPILFIRAWYRGAEFKDIRHGNLREWVSGSFFNRAVEECTEEEVAELDDTIGYIQRATGLAACRGYNSAVPCIRFTMDPLNSVHRPLVMYAVLQSTGYFAGRNLFALLGFKQVQGPFFRYWVRIAPGNGGEERAKARGLALQQQRLPPGTVLREMPSDTAGAEFDSSTSASCDNWTNSSANASIRGPYSNMASFDTNYPANSSSAGNSFGSAGSSASVPKATGVWDEFAPEHTAYGAGRPRPQKINSKNNSSRGNSSRSSANSSFNQNQQNSDHISSTSANGGAGAEWPNSSHSRRPSFDHGAFADPVEAAEAAAGAVVFCHGIGIGAWTYMPLLYQLIQRYPHRDVFVPEFDYVSMRLSEYVPSARQNASGVRLMLAEYGHETAVLMGHSYGTFVVSYCLRFATRIVEHVILIDPVCFLIHQVDGPFQFLFAPPSCAQSRMIHFLAQTELGVVHTLSRRLWWYQVRQTA